MYWRRYRFKEGRMREMRKEEIGKMRIDGEEGKKKAKMRMYEEEKGNRI